MTSAPSSFARTSVAFHHRELLRRVAEIAPPRGRIIAAMPISPGCAPPPSARRWASGRPRTRRAQLHPVRPPDCAATADSTESTHTSSNTPVGHGPEHAPPTTPCNAGARDARHPDLTREPSGLFWSKFWRRYRRRFENLRPHQRSPVPGLNQEKALLMFRKNRFIPHRSPPPLWRLAPPLWRGSVL